MVLNTKIQDAEDEMLQLLQQIARNTGSLESSGQDITIQGQSAKSRVGTFEPRDLIIQETAALDGANDDGSMTVEPGQTRHVLDFEGPPHALLAVGATDETDVEYSLWVDDRQPIGGTTQSPLGTLNSPFSFPNELGGAPHAEKRTVLNAKLDKNAAGPVNIVARGFMEVL